MAALDKEALADVAAYGQATEKLTDQYIDTILKAHALRIAKIQPLFAFWVASQAAHLCFQPPPQPQPHRAYARHHTSNPPATGRRSLIFGARWVVLTNSQSGQLFALRAVNQINQIKS